MGIEWSEELDEEGERKPKWRVELEEKLSTEVVKLSNKELFEKTFELTDGSGVESEYGDKTFTYGDWVIYKAHKEELEKRLQDWFNQ